MEYSDFWSPVSQVFAEIVRVFLPLFLTPSNQAEHNQNSWDGGSGRTFEQSQWANTLGFFRLYVVKQLHIHVFLQLKIPPNWKQTLFLTVGDKLQ